MSERVKSWTIAASRDLAVANKLDGFDTAASAYHFQQAAEKALKAASIMAGLDFRRTHNIASLWSALAEEDLLPALDDNVLSRINRLSFMNVVARYPVMDEETPPSKWVSQTDVAESREICQYILSHLESRFGLVFEDRSPPSSTKDRKDRDDGGDPSP